MSLLVNSPTNTLVPVYREAARPSSDTIMRCQRCRCKLASDQIEHYCSPCQRYLNGTPDWICDLIS